MSIGDSDIDYKKVETKDSMWKPAPIMGREISQPQMTFSQPTITSNLRSTQQQQNYVLPSHFQRADTLQRNEEPKFERVEASTDDRVVQVSNPITNPSALPDLLNQSSLPIVTGGQTTQGKTIYAASELKQTKA